LLKIGNSINFSIVVQVINEVLKYLVSLLATRLMISTRSGERVVMMTTLTMLTFVNSAVLIIIENTNFIESEIPFLAALNVG
jgi:hypothetical protein